MNIPSLPLTTTISLVPCRVGWDFGGGLVGIVVPSGFPVLNKTGGTTLAPSLG